MEKKFLRILTVGVVSLIMLVFAYILCDSISVKNIGDNYDYEKLVKTITVGLMTVIIIRILFLVIINPSEVRKGRKMPSILKYLIGLGIIMLAAIFVVTSVYSKSAMVIFAALGASGFGIAYIGQDFFKELFAGVVLAFQNDFRVGDWVKFPNGTIAKIIKMKLTGVDLWLLDDTQLYVSNTDFTGQAMINLNQPSQNLWAGVEVVLEHKVPVDRARRILSAAVLETSGLASSDILIVADKVQQNGVLFLLFFNVPKFEVFREIRHRVISSVARVLHKYGIKVCEISGEYNIRSVNELPIQNFNDNYVTDARTALEFSGLLKDCSEEIQMNFANNMTELTFSAGQTICKQNESGETMFIIAEGVVNVSIDISVDQDDGSIKSSSEVVATLSEGDYFGEMALLRGEKRSATITAKTDVVIYEVRRSTVKVFLNKYPDFARKLSVALIERNKINELTKSEVIEFLSQKEDEISKFMEAFKTFLGT